MERVGRVISVKDGMADLEVRKVSSCGSNCASCSAACEQAPQVIKVIDSLQVQPGDFVEVKADSSRVLKFMLILYGIPLLFLIIGFSLGHSYFLSIQAKNYEILALLVGLVAMVLGAMVVRFIDKKSKVRSENINFMVKKL
ncbi:MAG: SoxR reducing system RseC family protein [Bacillota bacterium]|nr:SoxR reducing system RseC family protein [Bacillota bacterium]